MEIKKVKLSTIKLNPDNPRFIKDEQFERLKKSLKEFPEMLVKRPIAYDETNENMVLGGNQRLRALKDLGYKEIPENWLIKCGDWTDEQKERFTITDNIELGDWNFDLLENWNKDLLENWGLDLPAIKDDEKEIEEPLNYEDLLYNSDITIYKNTSVFESTNRWSIPDIDPDMIFDYNKEIKTIYNGITFDETFDYLYIWKNTVNKIPHENTILGFYLRDVRFKDLMTDIELYIDNFKEYKAIISPNYTLWENDPAVLRLWRTYQSRWLGRYFQKAGIEIIPDIEFSFNKVYSDFEFVFDGLPEKCKTIAMQQQSKYSKEDEKTLLNEYIPLILERLNPNDIIIYGDKFQNKINDMNYGNQYNWHFLPSINNCLKLIRKKK